MPRHSKHAKIALADLGVQVIPYHEWPILYGGASKRKTLTSEEAASLGGFVTTQAYVYDDLVADRMSKITAGDLKPVELVRTGGHLCVFDGHHALAAYLKLGVPILCAFYGAGSDRIEPPRLFVRRD